MSSNFCKRYIFGKTTLSESTGLHIGPISLIFMDNARITKKLPKKKLKAEKAFFKFSGILGFEFSPLGQLKVITWYKGK